MKSSYSLALERYLQDSSGPPTLPPNRYPYRHPHPHSDHQMHSPTPPRSAGFTTGGSGRRGQERPRLLLMGQRRFVIPTGVEYARMKLSWGSFHRSGKSSISHVVFHKMPPTETLFIESTTRITKNPIQYVFLILFTGGQLLNYLGGRSFMDFQVWDFPGQIDFFDATFDFENIFGEQGALIWVIDAQDDYLESLGRLHATIIQIQRHYPCINVEVFIHKVDGLSDDYKIDTQRDIVQRTQDELSDAGFDNVQISYHLTSIYDHSIFEAFSKVIQKLIPQLGTLENLLNVLCSNSGIEKAFLFDVLSKIYIATDGSPVDVQSYGICSDYIDVIVDISEIYG